ncbi:hypothetical protein SUDANB105_01494 [Streptomyces sp. enrichment culture]
MTNNLAGWAQYGYCASHSRFFWGLRLHLVCTLHGLPIAFALTGAKADERETLLDLLTAERDLLHGRSNTNSPSRASGQEPSCSNPCDRSSSRSIKTFKGELDLEQHRGRTPGGVIARVMQRILALTATIWHNDATGQTVLRSLTAYDH